MISASCVLEIFTQDLNDIIAGHHYNDLITPETLIDLGQEFQLHTETIASRLIEFKKAEWSFYYIDDEILAYKDFDTMKEAKQAVNGFYFAEEEEFVYEDIDD